MKSCPATFVTATPVQPSLHQAATSAGEAP